MAVLPLSLTIAACSQPNIAAESKPANESASATQSTSEVKLESKTAPANVHSNTQSAVLHNVSATVYKDANCGCCKEWVSHAEGYGLNATAQNVEDVSLFKDRYSVPQQMRSCHTTVTTDGYVFEGHVPAKYMAQF
ncbi:hypothetical protein PKHYL_21070 [Psychrobacter sp. KH172YL61]|nr:hypothetical protein PKHYL_21070 [Psychrobacter sp. KH172YL61]